MDNLDLGTRFGILATLARSDSNSWEKSRDIHVANIMIMKGNDNSRNWAREKISKIMGKEKKYKKMEIKKQ